MHQRLKKARTAAREKDIGALLISGEKNIRYLTGFTGDSSQILITDSHLYFFTDFRYTEQVENELSKIAGVKIHQTTASQRYAAIFNLAADLGVKNVGIDEDQITVDIYERIKCYINPRQIVFFAGDMQNLRSIKDEAEIAAIIKAAKITDEAFDFILGLIKPGMSEDMVNAELKYYFHKKGFTEAFSPIVISGAKTSLPHGKPSGKIIQKGDFITLDFGCAVDGYCSDFTRTVVVGLATQEQREVYEIVKTAQQHALDAGKAGMSAKMLDNFARQVIINKGYANSFAHGLGHGVGLDIHEAPTINAESDTTLKENMVITIEPGIYLKGRFGVRIEDLCLVKKDGLINLCTASKQFTTI